MELLNRKEAAGMLNCSVTKVRRLEADGYLVPVKLPTEQDSKSDRTLILYDSEDIKRLVEASKDYSNANKSIFNPFEYSKQQIAKHTKTLDQIIEENRFNKELLYHLEYFKQAFPTAFEALPNKVKEYYQNQIEQFQKERKEAGQVPVR